jgi:hypothetical protein
MAVWETDTALPARSELIADFANVWQAAGKVVYSTTLDAVPTAKAKLERNFDSDVQVVGIAVSSGCSGPYGMSRRSSPVRSARTTTRAT